jgi:hypothetical protein
LKQIEWKEDASDLMDETESFHLNLREGRSWKKPHDDRARAYALKASDASVSSDSTKEIMESNILKKESSTLKKYVKAFAATEKQFRQQKYKWKQVPPKDGESTTKRVLVDGVRKKYYWCLHHKAWTLHSPQECSKSEENRKKRKSPNKHEGSSKRKRTYDKASIAFEALALLAQSNPTSPSSSSIYTEDSNQDSNFSGTTNSSSSSRSSTQSYKTAEYDTDES